MSEKSAQVLKKYLFEKKMKKCDFAQSCHICRFSVFKYLNGKPVRKSIAEQIQRATNDEIMAAELLQ